MPKAMISSSVACNSCLLYFTVRNASVVQWSLATVYNTFIFYSLRLCELPLQITSEL